MSRLQDAERVEISAVVSPGAHLIGGSFVPGTSGETIDVLDPATGAPIFAVAAGDAADIDDAVRAAHDAFPAWKRTNPAERAALLLRWAELCDEHAETIDELEAREVGRPLGWGMSPTAPILRYVAGMADKLTGATLPTASPDALAMTLREPFGVCGAILPWNHPAPLLIVDVAPAIAAGNTIVVKPAEDAPITALFLAKLAGEAGIPGGVVNVVTGYGATAGAALAEHPLVRRMSFTGSPETGSLVMQACARRVVPLQLELGGKSPQILFEDADLDVAIPNLVRSITYNSGQVCGAGSRVLVAESIRPQVIEALREGFAGVSVGAWHERPDMGPLISAKQLERVRGYIDAGVDEGARVVSGGREPLREPGFFVAPTIFDGVDPGMRIAREEIFGPVLAVLGFTTEQQALELANGTDYGLVAYVWTRDVGRAVRFGRELEAGTVCVNANGPMHGGIGAPHGGFKRSGFGRAMGFDALNDYTQVKSLVIQG